MHKGIAEIEPATVEAAKHFAEKELSTFFDISTCFPRKTTFKYTVPWEKAPKIELGKIKNTL